MIQSLNQQSIPSASTQPKLPYELTSTSGNGGSSEKPAADNGPMREAFGDFVGQTLFGSMLSSMRKSLDKPAYFHGGRAEEVFQEQLDQKLVEEISDASADSFVNPMFDLFQLQRRG